MLHKQINPIWPKSFKPLRANGVHDAIVTCSIYVNT